ncbi:MAG: anti-sigma factor domain-containing protein [Anaerovoracaceae bacterium]
MKGIVVDIKEGMASLLTENGEIRGIKDRTYRIGEEVILRERPRIRLGLLRWGAGVAAAFVLFVTGAFAYTTPDAYISVDVNPSVEIAINIFDRVVDVKAVNDDGVELLSSISLKHMAIEKAMQQLTDKLIEGNYITNDENGGVIITTSGENQAKAEKLAIRLEASVRECIDEEGKTAAVEAEAVGLERVKEAEKLGVTPGKLNLVEKLVKSSPDPEDIVIEEWLDKPVKDINKLIKENKKALKEQEKADRKDKDKEQDDEEDAIDKDDGDQPKGVKSGKGKDPGETPDWNNSNKEKEKKEVKEKNEEKENESGKGNGEKNKQNN